MFELGTRLNKFSLSPVLSATLCTETRDEPAQIRTGDLLDIENASVFENTLRVYVNEPS